MPMRYTWITDPPIQRLALAADVVVAANALDDIVNWTTGSLDENLLDMDTSVRYSDICEDMRDRANNHFDDYEFYVYRISGTPVVLMAISTIARYQEYIPGNGVWIEGTIASPYVVGGGILMKEYAVNLSRQKGYAGRIGCAAASGEAQNSWERMGMTATGRTYVEENDGEQYEFPVLFLDPATRPAIWEPHGGGWIFRNMRYTMSSEKSLV